MDDVALGGIRAQGTARSGWEERSPKGRDVRDVVLTELNASTLT